MTEINLESLLSPITPEAPSGESSLENDPEFMKLKIGIRGTPERELGGKIVQEAKDPKWRDIQKSALKLLTRSHDLQVAMFLARALLHTNGIKGLATSLELLHGLISQYWDSLYPQLDPMDNNDPVQRINILVSLSEGQDIMGPLTEQTLCHSPQLGKYSYRDILIANGKITATSKDKTPSPTLDIIDAAFKDTDVDTLLATQTALKKSSDHLTSLKTALKQKVGTSHATSVTDFKGLDQVIKEMDATMIKYLKHHKKDINPDHAAEDGISAEGPSISHGSQSMDVINNRQDVIRLLDLICDYYEKNEPGSPIPLLLKRTRQLVQKNFIEIIQDLAPDSAGKIKNLIIGNDQTK